MCNIGNKKCTKCLVEKSKDDFHQDSKKPDGRHSVCKKCRLAKMREYYKCQSARNRKIEYQKRYYQENKEAVVASIKRWIEANKEKVAEYRENWNKKRAGDYVRKKPDQKIIYKRFKERYKSDPVFRLKYLSRQRIIRAFKDKGWKKTSKTQEYLKCDWETLKIHIESQFDDGMTWDNYGEWHIDHKIPLCIAQNEHEIKALTHYTNLQPLWAKENMAKSGKIIV